jgi:hypothetical protein
VSVRRLVVFSEVAMRSFSHELKEPHPRGGSIDT